MVGGVRTYVHCGYIGNTCFQFPLQLLFSFQNQLDLFAIRNVFGTAGVGALMTQTVCSVSTSATSPKTAVFSTVPSTSELLLFTCLPH